MPAGTVDINTKSNHNTVSMYTRKTVRINNILSFCETVQHSITASQGKPQTTIADDDSDQAPRVEVHAAIQERAQHIFRILEEKDAHAGHLPIRSRRAFQWLMFLSRQKSYQQHLSAVRTLYQAACQVGKPVPQSDLTVQITLFHIGPLYRIKHEHEALKITLHESFLIAPRDVLTAVVALAFDKGENNAQDVIHSFSSSPSCAELREQIAYTGIPPLAGVQGDHKNLHHAFQRVNKRYFQGDLSRPHLVWSKRLTHRKFGHYQYETDTVLISRSLDDANLSDALLDFVMFHELLHKNMGYKEINGRRYSHTPPFRKRERAFHNYQEMKTALNNLSRTLS